MHKFMWLCPGRKSNHHWLLSSMSMWWPKRGTWCKGDRGAETGSDLHLVVMKMNLLGISKTNKWHLMKRQKKRWSAYFARLLQWDGHAQHRYLQDLHRDVTMVEVRSHTPTEEEEGTRFERVTGLMLKAGGEVVVRWLHSIVNVNVKTSCVDQMFTLRQLGEKIIEKIKWIALRALLD